MSLSSTPSKLSSSSVSSSSSSSSAVATSSVVLPATTMVPTTVPMPVQVPAQKQRRIILTQEMMEENVALHQALELSLQSQYLEPAVAVEGQGTSSRDSKSIIADKSDMPPVNTQYKQMDGTTESRLDYLKSVLTGNNKEKDKRSDLLSQNHKQKQLEQLMTNMTWTKSSNAEEEPLHQYEDRYRFVTKVVDNNTVAVLRHRVDMFHEKHKPRRIPLEVLKKEFPEWWMQANRIVKKEMPTMSPMVDISPEYDWGYTCTSDLEIVSRTTTTVVLRNRRWPSVMDEVSIWALPYLNKTWAKWALEHNGGVVISHEK